MTKRVTGLLLVLILAVSAASGFAYGAAPAEEGVPGVSAKGDARAQAQVDTFRLVLTLEVTENTVDRARDRLMSLEQDLTQLLQQVVGRDAVVAGQMILETPELTKGGRGGGGVMARRSYTVEGVPAEKFGDWVELITSTELPVTGSFEFVSSKGPEAVDTATRRAIAEAEVQAKAAAEASGAQLGPTRQIVVHRTVTSPSGTFGRKAVRFESPGGGKVGGVVAGGVVTVEVRVEAIWELK